MTALDMRPEWYYGRILLDANWGLSTLPGTVMDVTKHVRPLTAFKRDTARFMARLRNAGGPAVPTLNGKPAPAVMEAAAWRRRQERVEFARTVAGIRKGPQQTRGGECVEAGEYFETIGVRKA